MMSLRGVPASGLRATGRLRQLQQASHSARLACHVLAQSEAAVAPACPSGLPSTHLRMPRDSEGRPEGVAYHIRDGMPICTAGQS
jgi:hypothetical protein